MDKTAHNHVVTVKMALPVTMLLVTVTVAAKRDTSGQIAQKVRFVSSIRATRSINQLTFKHFMEMSMF